jgi:enolase-phosphatase E1
MPKLYLLDIEGTTSPISFVYDVLFPYARERMSDYMTRHGNEPSLRADLQLLAQESRSDRANGAPTIDDCEPPLDMSAEIIQASIDYLIRLMNQDRKSTALKSVQGRIWAEGYERGDLHGEVFPDVPAALRRWRRTARVAIYSSGSVEAQRYLFTYAKCGDLTHFIDAYFDTRTGPKLESASYQKIATAMKVAASEVLFVSDAVRELDAAREAAMMTLLSLRPGNPPVANNHGHPAISSFENI